MRQRRNTAALINKISGINFDSLSDAIKEKFADKGETIISQNILAIKKISGIN